MPNIGRVMHSNITRRIRTKVNDGLGGIKCPCCRGCIKNLKLARTLNNRIIRRKIVAALRGIVRGYNES